MITWPYGYGSCCCGCGNKTNIAIRNDSRKTWVKGEPKKWYGPSCSKRKSWKPEDLGYKTPCHVWQGSPDHKGYGKLFLNGKMKFAHKEFWEQKHGNVPAGKQLDHLCRNRICCNPDHLEVVTNAENTRRGLSTKLNKAKVRRIRRDIRPRPVVASEYGVTPHHIWAIQTNRAWVADMNE